MIPYVLLMAVPCVFAVLSHTTEVRLGTKVLRSNSTLFSFFALLLLLLSFRGLYIGNDTASYKDIFDTIGTLSWDDLELLDLEFGFLALSKVLIQSGFTYQGFLFVVSLLSLLPLVLFYNKYSEQTLLTIAIFVAVAPFSMYFSGLRQILAMALVFPAFEFACKKRIVPFLLTVAVAYAFHMSAFVLLFLLPVCFFRVTPKWLWFVIPTFVLVLIFNRPIFLFLLEHIRDLYDGDVVATGAYTTLILLILFTVFSYVIPDEAKMDETTTKLRNVLLLSLYLQPFAAVNPIAMRLNYYFLLFIPVLIPRIVRRAKVELDLLARIATVVLIVVFVAYFYVNLIGGGGLNIYPYVPFWSEI